MSSSSSTPATSAGSISETDAVVRLFGTDAWMRFDLWSNRAWESAQGAVTIAAAIGQPIGSEDNLDPRIIAHFHAAEIARGFAEMVNPLIAVAGIQCEGSTDTSEHANITPDMFTDVEEQG